MIPNIVKHQKPLPRTQRLNYKGDVRFSGLPARENRAAQIRRSDDTFKGVHVGLEEIDGAVLYYFKNVIKPTVEENGKLVPVPVQYANSEYWEDIQKTGYIRDQKGKVIAPVIIVRRTNVSRDDQIGVDKLNRNITHQFPIKWSQKNRYDRFSLLTGGARKQTYEVYNMVVPDYINVEYECIILTSFIPQLNAITEKIFYNEGQFWGDPKKFKFSTRIDSFDQNIDITTDKGRLVKSTFNLSLKGYLIPEYYDDYSAVTKTYSTQRVVIGTETEATAEEIFEKLRIKDYRVQNDIYTRPPVQAPADEEEVLNYLLSEKWKKADTITSNINGYSRIVFDNTIIYNAPNGIADATKYDFLFFVNGLYMEHDALTISQGAYDLTVYSNIAQIGYEITQADEVFAWGFFQ